MLTYSYSLTEEQLLDCNKKYRKKTLKPAVTFVILLPLLIVLFFGVSFIEGFKDIRILAYFFLMVEFFMALVVIFSKKGVAAQVGMYFKSCQVDGAVDYEFQLLETEFVVLQPKRGNVHHYLYESILKVTEVDGYVALILQGNQYIPVLANEHTAPLIRSLQSLAKSK